MTVGGGGGAQTHHHHSTSVYRAMALAGNSLLNMILIIQINEITRSITYRKESSNL